MYSPYQFNPYPQALPPQQVLQANGKASVDAIRMSPNSSVLVMDTTAPIIWLCTSDSLGNVTSTPYDITLHVDAKTREETDVETRLAAVEQNVNDLLQKWGDLNAKSNAVNVKSKQVGRNGGTDSTD